MSVEVDFVIKTDYGAIFDLPENVEPGTDAVKLAQARIGAFAQRWRDSYPPAVCCLLDDRRVAAVNGGAR